MYRQTTQTEVFFRLFHLLFRGCSDVEFETEYEYFFPNHSAEKKTQFINVFNENISFVKDDYGFNDFLEFLKRVNWE